MPEKNNCAEYSKKYNDLVALREKFSAMPKNRETRVAALDLKKKIDASLGEFKLSLDEYGALFPRKVSVKPWVNVYKLGTVFGVQTLLLREGLEVDWLFLQNLVSSHWFGLFKKNSKYYLIFDEIAKDDFFGNKPQPFLKEKRLMSVVKNWLSIQKALQFNSKESAIKYILRDDKILSALEKKDVLEKLDEKAAWDYWDQYQNV